MKRGFIQHHPVDVPKPTDSSSIPSNHPQAPKSHPLTSALFAIACTHTHTPNKQVKMGW